MKTALTKSGVPRARVGADGHDDMDESALSGRRMSSVIAELQAAARIWRSCGMTLRDIWRAEKRAATPILAT